MKCCVLVKKFAWLTPEEEARNKMVMRERDRERKRLKRMNPEYRRMEQERDRDRKKARRANEAFRQLEKLRDKIRKERKKGIIVDEAALAQQFNLVRTTPAAEPDAIINDGSTPTEQRQQQTTQPSLGSQHQTTQQQHISQQHQPQRRRIQNTNSAISTNTNMANTTNSITTTTITSANTNNNNNTNNMANNLTQVTTANMPHSTNAAAVHMSQLNKGLLYPPPNFTHHPLPIPGVALMPSLCHPILHHNLSATLYPQNGIKQEYTENSPTTNAHNNQQSPTSTSGAAAANNSDDHEMNMIEPEIILQTSSEVLSAPHHFNNHAHAHHLHQQQCNNLFTHMTPQANMTAAHMRVAAYGSHIPPSASALAAAVAAVQSQHQQQQHPTSQHTLTQQQQPQHQTQQ